MLDSKQSRPRIIIERVAEGYNFELPEGHTVVVGEESQTVTLSDASGNSLTFNAAKGPKLGNEEERYYLGDLIDWPPPGIHAPVPNYRIVHELEERARLIKRWVAAGHSDKDYMVVKEGSGGSAIVEFDAIRGILDGKLTVN